MATSLNNGGNNQQKQQPERPTRQSSNSMSLSQYPLFKILLIGDTSTAKTTFLTHLIHRVPERLPKPTTNLSVFTMRMSKPKSVVQIWDSPGDSKYYYRILGYLGNDNTANKQNIAKGFDAILVFVDVTNEYTYDRARIIVQQISKLKSLSTSPMQIHIVQSKLQPTQKDPLKLKVAPQKLRSLIDRFQGGLFEYRQKQQREGTEPASIIQDVLEWKTKQKEIQLRQKERQKQRQIQLPKWKEPTFERESITPNCECRVF